FFFSSRRRHTRFSRDWSSDVCSSDLQAISGNEAIVRAVEREGLPSLAIAAPFGYLGRRYALHLEFLDTERARTEKLDLRVGAVRSEERRVGKECRSREAPDQVRQERE